MKDYLIFSIVVFASVAYASFAIGSKDPAVRFALGGILIASLLPPAISAIKNFEFSEEGFYSEEIASDAASDAAEAAVVKGLKRALSEKFFIDEEDINIVLYGFDLETLRSSEVSIGLEGKAAFSDIGGIRRFVEDNGFGNCVTEVEFGG